jgi:predicted ATPase/DNA-binding CsgD family transcriptional regulator
VRQKRALEEVPATIRSGGDWPGPEPNLPTQLTSFIGREAELLDLERLIAERRLVTLTGVGGCGKTRLAVQLGSRFADRLPDGVWLVDLGSVTDPALIPRLTASTLGVLIEPGGDPVQALAAQLRGRRLLLCLDTCEHLLEATAALVDTLLRSCPGLSVLATSRAPLGVEGETVWRVPSLKGEDAVQLFADRAGLVAPGLDLDAVHGDVRVVCSRLDHIPLAIELAAAWTRALSPGQIAAGLEDSLQLLAGGPRGAVPRHQTLLASMAWSHALLDEQERVLFRRLAVFSGTFTLDAATKVCADADVDPASHPGALQLMGRLLDKSLVAVRESGHEVRYRLLDTIRQYAEEQLRVAGETEALRDRHLDYFLRLAEEAEPGLDSDQDTWREALDSHHDNINAALHWGLSPPARRADRGRRLAAAMARQWFLRGQSHEGLAFLGRAIALDPADRSALQSRLYAGTAMVAVVSGRADLVTEAAARGLEIAAEVGADTARARCLTLAAYPMFFVDFERTQALAVEARAAGEAAGDPFTRDWAALLEGYSLIASGRYAEGVTIARLAFERSWPRGDRFCAAFARGIEIIAAMVSGDVREAVAIGQDAVRIATPLRDFFAVGTNTANAAITMGMAGDLAQARKMMDPVVRSLGTALDVDVVGFMVAYGLLHLWDGDPAGAVHWFERGVQRMSRGSRDWTATRCLPGLVGALRRLGRTEEASEYAARAVTLATEFGAPHELANVLDEQARLIRAQDPGRARDLHHEALALRVGSGLRTYYVDSLDALAWLEVEAGNRVEAVRMLAVSDAARDEMGYPRPPVDLPEHEGIVASLRAGLGDEEFAALWREAAGRSLEDMVSAVTRGRGPRARPEAGWESLTPTEVDVVRLITQGLSNPAIATRLYMSRSTVKAHLSHIYAKLRVANRTELATLASSQPIDR